MGGRGSGSGGAAAVAKQKAERKINRTPFKNDGLGQWELDTPFGGGSILDESDGEAGGYGQMRAYSAVVWDKDYGRIGETRYFGSLNAAKSAVKDRLKAML